MGPLSNKVAWDPAARAAVPTAIPQGPAPMTAMSVCSLIAPVEAFRTGPGLQGGLGAIPNAQSAVGATVYPLASIPGSGHRSVPTAEPPPWALHARRGGVSTGERGWGRLKKKLGGR